MSNVSDSHELSVIDSSLLEINDSVESDHYIYKNEEQTSNKIQTNHKNNISNDNKSIKGRKNNNNYSKSFKCDICEIK